MVRKGLTNSFCFYLLHSKDFCVFFSVLPKFEVTLNAKDEVSVGQEEVDVEVCAK